MPLILFLLFTSLFLNAQNQPHWVIAHRGGVVDSIHPENSVKGLEEAIRRGYTHVEIDLRMTADQQLVCYHNEHLNKEKKGAGLISEMTLKEVQRIQLHNSQEHIPSFEEICKRCQGRINIMVDIKGCKYSQINSYCSQIENTLRQYNLLENSLILINQFTLNHQVPIAKYFLGKVKISWRKSLSLAQRESKRDSNFSQKYYVFNHGNDFSKKSIDNFHILGLKVVISINKGHFLSDFQTKGEDLIRKNLSFGADGFQIDACFDHLLLTK